MKIIKKATGGTVTLTGDAAETDVANGKTFYSDSTTKKTGTLVPLDTSDATAAASDIASGKTAYVSGSKVTGTASGGSATEPYIEYTIVNYQITAAKLYGFNTIPSKMFNSQNNLASVDLSESPNIASVVASAFLGCSALESINLPNVQIVDVSAFQNCTDPAFTSITLGSAGHAVTTIGTNAFSGDTQITAIDIYTAGGASLANQPWGATNATVTYHSA